jgi:hypothetical protein
MEHVERNNMIRQQEVTENALKTYKKIFLNEEIQSEEHVIKEKRTQKIQKMDIMKEEKEEEITLDNMETEQVEEELRGEEKLIEQMLAISNQQNKKVMYECGKTLYNNHYFNHEQTINYPQLLINNLRFIRTESLPINRNTKEMYETLHQVCLSNKEFITNKKIYIYQIHRNVPSEVQIIKIKPSQQVHYANAGIKKADILLHEICEAIMSSEKIILITIALGVIYIAITYINQQNKKIKQKNKGMKLLEIMKKNILKIINKHIKKEKLYANTEREEIISVAVNSGIEDLPWRSILASIKKFISIIIK